MGFLFRLLFIAALIYFIIRLVKKTRQQTQPSATQQPGGPIQMTKCAECQVLFPKTEAISKGQQSFCSTEHLHKWLEKQ